MKWVRGPPGESANGRFLESCMTGMGRYADLYIATTMRRSQLCAGATMQMAPAPMTRRLRSRCNLHIVTAPRSIRYAASVPFPSLPSSRTRRVTEPATARCWSWKVELPVHPAPKTMFRSTPTDPLQTPRHACVGTIRVVPTPHSCDIRIGVERVNSSVVEAVIGAGFLGLWPRMAGLAENRKFSSTLTYIRDSP